MPSVGLDRIGRYGQHAEERDPVPREARAERVLDARLLVDPDLVDDRAGDRDAVRLEVGRVEHDLVDRPADAALGDDDRRRAEHRRDHGVRQPDDRADARVPGALDEQHVVVRELAVGGRMRAPRSSTTLPAMYAFVNPRGMWTGLMAEYGSGRSKIDS